jgi:hypothetical protein
MIGPRGVPEHIKRPSFWAVGDQASQDEPHLDGVNLFLAPPCGGRAQDVVPMHPQGNADHFAFRRSGTLAGCPAFRPGRDGANLHDVTAGRALGVRWGTFQLIDEAREKPVEELATALRAASIAPERFVAAEAGGVYRFA